MRLLITGTDRLTPPPLPDPEDAGVTLLLGPQDELCGLAHRVDKGYWLHVPEVASYHYDPAKEHEVAAVPVDDAPEDSVQDEFLRTIWPRVLQLRGQAVLHASAVRTPGGVVGLCAPSETGKSTLAYGLSERGFQLWGDDALVFNVEAGRVNCTSLPFHMRLRPASAVYFGHATYEERVEDRWRGAAQETQLVCQLAAVCMLERVPGLPEIIRFERLAPTQAFQALYKQASYFSLEERTLKKRMTQQYLQVSSLIPVMQVKYQTGLENVEAILDGFEAFFSALS